ncbi:kinase-like protein [Cubamyces sp. BRFM 1775]|nr:kinase-like protein [Cubamyces sp. BRFM 1775]
MSRPMFTNPFARGAVKTGDGGASARLGKRSRSRNVESCASAHRLGGSCEQSRHRDSAVVLLSPPARPVDSRRQGRVYDETVNIYAPQQPPESTEPQRTRKASFLARKSSKILPNPAPIIKKVAGFLRPKESSAEARRDALRSQLALNPPPKSLADFPPHPVEPSQLPRPTYPPRPPPIDLDVLEYMRRYSTVEELERAVDREKKVNIVATPRTPASVRAEVRLEQPEDPPHPPPKAERVTGSLQAIPAKRRKIGVVPSLYRNVPSTPSQREPYWEVLQVHRKRVPPQNEAKWITGGVLGQGGFGTVLLVYDVARGAQCALKVVHYSRGMSQPSCRGVVNELKALAKLAADVDPSPFLLRPCVHGTLWAWRSSGGYLHILTELCNGGDLSCYEYRLSEDALALVCAEVILGLDHLHKLGIVHHDLKPQNILVTSEGHCVISDFGGAQFLDRDQRITREPRGANAVMTVPFAAPELLCNEDSETTYTQAVDYWSLGTTLVSLLMEDAYLPGTDSATQLNLKLSGIDQRLQEGGTSVELRAFIKALLQPDASKRPLFPEIAELSFLQAVDWEAVQDLRCPPIRMVRELGALAHGFSIPAARVHETRHPVDFLQMLRHEQLSLTVDDSYDVEAHMAAVTYEL